MPDDYAPAAERDGEEDEEDGGEPPDAAPEGEPAAAQADAAALEDGPLARAALERCRIIFCTGDTEALVSKPKLACSMHAITVGTAHAKLLTQGLEALASSQAALAVEVRVLAGLYHAFASKLTCSHAARRRVPTSCLR